MRRFAIIALTLLAACFRPSGATDQPTSFTVPGTPEQVLAKADAELAQMGFRIVSREQRTILTDPRPIPDSLARVSGGSRLWLIRVSAKPQVFTAGSSADVRAYLVPAAEVASRGNQLQLAMIEVTRDRPELFNEVRRIAGQIQRAAER